VTGAADVLPADPHGAVRQLRNQEALPAHVAAINLLPMMGRDSVLRVGHAVVPAEVAAARVQHQVAAVWLARET